MWQVKVDLCGTICPLVSRLLQFLLCLAKHGQKFEQEELCLCPHVYCCEIRLMRNVSNVTAQSGEWDWDKRLIPCTSTSMPLTLNSFYNCIACRHKYYCIAKKVGHGQSNASSMMVPAQGINKDVVSNAGNVTQWNPPTQTFDTTTPSLSES